MTAISHLIIINIDHQCAQSMNQSIHEEKKRYVHLSAAAMTGFRSQRTYICITLRDRNTESAQRIVVPLFFSSMIRDYRVFDF